MDADVTYCNEQLHKIGQTIKSLNQMRQDTCQEIHHLDMEVGRLKKELKKIRQSVMEKQGLLTEINNKLYDTKFERNRMRIHLKQLRVLKSLGKIQNKMIEKEKKHDTK